MDALLYIVLLLYTPATGEMEKIATLEMYTFPNYVICAYQADLLNDEAWFLPTADGTFLTTKATCYTAL